MRRFVLGWKKLGLESLSDSLRITLADIPAATSLYRYFELEIERPAVRNVEGWYRRLQQRPAYREHVLIPFGELHGRLDLLN